MVSTEKIKYSVIIPTYNRASRLQETVRSCIEQDIPSDAFEIIIVDDGSIDTTREVVDSVIQSYPHHHIVYAHKQNGGSGSARNLGIRKARGVILFFTDDDCIVPSNWMSTYIERFEKYPDVMGVGGWYKEHVDTANVYSDMIHLEAPVSIPFFESTEVYTNDKRYTLFGITGNVAYKKELFTKVGLFREDIRRMVDWEFRERLFSHRFATLYVPLMVQHKDTLSLFGLVRRQFKYGLTRYWVLQLHPYAYRPSIVRAYQVAEYVLATARALRMRLSRFIVFVHKFSDWAGYATAQLLYFFEKKKLSPYMSSLSPIEVQGIEATPLFLIEYKQGDLPRESRWAPVSLISSRPEYYLIRSELLMPSQKGIQVSIVIPFYNRASFLKSIITSLSKQVMHASWFEIIIADDGSTDNTEEQFNIVQGMYPQMNMHYHYKANGGAASARNFGARYARGKYIYFVDSDVLLPLHIVPNWCAMMHLHPEVVAVGGGQVTYRADLLKASSFNRMRNMFHQNKRSGAYLITNSTRVGLYVSDTANVMYRRDFFEKSGGFNERYSLACEDTEFAYRLQREGAHMLWAPFHVENVGLVSFWDMFGKMKIRAQGGIMLERQFPDDFFFAMSKAKSESILFRALYWAIRPIKHGSTLVAIVYDLYQIELRK